MDLASVCVQARNITQWRQAQLQALQSKQKAKPTYRAIWCVARACLPRHASAGFVIIHSETRHLAVSLSAPATCRCAHAVFCTTQVHAPTRSSVTFSHRCRSTGPGRVTPSPKCEATPARWMEAHSSYWLSVSHICTRASKYISRATGSLVLLIDHISCPVHIQSYQRMLIDERARAMCRAELYSSTRCSQCNCRLTLATRFGDVVGRHLSKTTRQHMRRHTAKLVCAVHARNPCGMHD